MTTSTQSATLTRGFRFTVSNKGVANVFSSQREAIQWARPLWPVGRVLQIHVTHVNESSSLYSHCVTYRKSRGQQFEYLGQHSPNVAVNP